eukprot:802712_1
MASVTDPEFAHLGLDDQNERYSGGLIIALCMTGLVSTALVELYDQTSREDAARAVAPAPYEKPREQSEPSEREMKPSTTPPQEVFEIGDLEMEVVDLDQFKKQRAQ